MSFVSRYLDPVLVERLNALALSGRRVVEGSTPGLHRSPVKGVSVEFRQHRFYAPGDEPRRLDWRVLARTDRPYIKEYDEETNFRGVILLDCSGSMAYGQPDKTKFDYAARLAAALAYLMLKQTESVGLGLFRQRIDHWLAPRGGTAQLSRLLTALDRSSPRGSASVAGALHDAGRRLVRRALVILISDFFCPPDRLRDGLARLRHDRHEVIAMQIVDRDEVDFPFQSWSRFRGLEGERAQFVEPALLRRTYLARFRAHRESLTEICRAAHAEFRTFVTDQPLIDALTTFLVHRAQ